MSAPPPPPASSHEPEGDYTIKDAEHEAKQMLAKGGQLHKDLLSKLSNRKVNKEVLEGAFKKMGTATRSRRHAKRFSRDRETINTLLESLRLRPKFTKMVEYSLECLKNLAVDRESAEDIIDAGAVEAIISIMQQNPFRENIQRLANDALCAMGVILETAGETATRLGPKEMIFSLENHSETETLISTCKTVTWLTRGGIDALKCNDMVDALVYVVKRNPEKEFVIAGSIEALNNLVDGHWEHMVASEGLLEAVVQALVRFDANPVLVEQVLAWLGKMGYKTEEIKAMLRKLGALDAVVQALSNFHNNNKILGLGATCMGALREEEDVVDSIGKIQRGNLSQETSFAMSKLAAMSLVDDNVEHIMRGSYLDDILKLMREALNDKDGEESADILANGARCLERLGKGSDMNIYHIMQKGGVAVLAQALEDFADDEMVVAAVLRALGTLASRDENATFIVQCGAPRLLALALAKHGDSEVVAKAGAYMAARVTAFDGSAKLCSESNITLEAVIRMLRAHGHVLEVATFCFEALDHLAGQSQGMRQAMFDLQGVQAALTRGKEHEDDEPGITALLKLIHTLAQDRNNKQPLIDLGTVDFVTEMMQKHKNNDEIHDLCVKILELLAAEDKLGQAVTAVRLATATHAEAGNDDTLLALLQTVMKLTNLCANPKNIEPLASLMADEVLIKAFRLASAYSQSETRDDILELCAEGLGYLASSSLVRMRVRGKAPDLHLKYILQVAIANPDLEDLAQYAMQLAEQCSADEQAVPALVADGILPLVVQLGSQHTEAERTLDHCVGAMAQLCQEDKELFQQSCMASGAEVVVESVFANVSDRDAVIRACNLVVKFAVDQPCIDAMIGAGAIKAIVSAMHRHEGDEEVQEACLRALNALIQTKEAAALLGELKGAAMLLSTARTHYKNIPVVDLCIELLRKLLWHDDNYERVLEPSLGAVSLLQWGLKAWKKHPEVKMKVEDVLSLLKAWEEAQRQKNKKKKKGKTVAIDWGDQAEVTGEMCGQLLNDLGGLDKGAEEDQGVKVTEDDVLLSKIAEMRQFASTAAGASNLIAGNGLEELARLLLANVSHEQMYMPISVAYCELIRNGEPLDPERMQKPLLVSALCSLVDGQPHFDGTKVSDVNLIDEMDCYSDMEVLSPEMMTQALEEGVFESLMNLTVDPSPDVAASAARLLSRLMEGEEVEPPKDMTLKDLIAAMRKNMDNGDFLAAATQLLGKFCASKSYQQELVDLDAVQLLLAIMDHHPDLAVLNERCALCLAALTDEKCKTRDACVARLVELQGVDTVIGALVMHVQVQPTAVACIRVLMNLCTAGHKEHVADSGSIAAVVDAVLALCQSKDTVALGFRAMGVLAFDHDHIEVLIDAGGAQSVVAGMTAHYKDKAIVTTGLKLLTLMASHPSKRKMKALEEQGAVHAVINVLERRQDDLASVTIGLVALAGMSKHKKVCRAIVDDGAVDCLSGLMTTYMAKPKFMQKAMTLLATVSGHSQNVDRMLVAGIVAPVIKAIRTHIKNQHVVVPGLTVLANLGFDSDHAKQLADAGAHTLALGIAKASMKVPHYLGAALYALGSFAMNEEVANGMKEKCIARVTQALDHDVDVDSVLPHALELLAHLTEHPSVAPSVLDTGVGASVLMAIHDNIEDPEVILQACLPLLNMALNGGDLVKQQMLDDGTKDEMEEAPTHHRKRNDVKRRCLEVLQALSGKVTIVTAKRKDARKIFQEDEDESAEHLSLQIINFLTAGTLINMHKAKGGAKVRRMYVTHDLKTICTTDPHNPRKTKELKVFDLRAIERGHCSTALKRKNLFGKFLAVKEQSFSVIFRHGKELSAEVKDEKLRERWVWALQALRKHREWHRAHAAQFNADEETARAR